MAIEIATVPTTHAPAAGATRRRSLAPLAVNLLLIAGLGLMTLASLGIGAVHISPRAIFAAMLWH